MQQIDQFPDKTNQTSLVGCWELDLQTNKVTWDKTTKEIFEVPDDFIPERRRASNFFKAGPNRNLLNNVFFLAVTKGIHYDFESQIITAKGNVLWLRHSGYPEFVNGECVSIYGIFQNINERKLNEAASEKEEQVQKEVQEKPENFSVELKASLLPDENFPGKKILITDNNPINVLIIKKYLQQWDVGSDVAENGKIACNLVSKNDYDLVLMDIQMPVMDGYEASTAIRKMEGDKFKHLPIIALTASTIDEIKEEILKSGIDGCLTKPFKSSQLYSILLVYFNNIVLK
jgi:CheY-like chemotaxis protein